MHALFVGQTYIDVTFLADELPTGDEKTVARDYAISFGGNAVTAAFACAKLGLPPDLLTSIADDWLGRMFIDLAGNYGIDRKGVVTGKGVDLGGRRIIKKKMRQVPSRIP